MKQKYFKLFKAFLKANKVKQSSLFGEDLENAIYNFALKLFPDEPIDTKD